jgi:uridine kinase
MHEQFIEPSKKHADVIIPEGANSVAVNLLKEKLRAEVEGDAVRSWERGSLEAELGEKRSLDMDGDD